MSTNITMRSTSLQQLCNESQHNQSCMIAQTHNQRRSLSRHYCNGHLVRPYPGIYAEAQYWQELNPADKTIHIARALAQLHPTWIFGAATAACIWQLDVPWHLIEPSITIAGNRNTPHSDATALHRFYAPTVEPVLVDGLRVTNIVRTAVDCARLCTPLLGATVMNAAVCRGITKQEIYACVNTIHGDCSRVYTLLPYLDPRCENGGETLALMTMTLELGFLKPRMQVVLKDPISGTTHRVDYYWETSDHRIIIAEFDGSAKYIDPSMTHGQTIHQVVGAEREREESLRRAGVHTIVRFTYSDVRHSERLRRKLEDAGIPYTSR